ncbi:MAG TPA: hypothetical protein VKV15_09250 [Bryobacteraceae bacterium]|nr:hypothetical protein [Bryobacteraceae bacterium]
MAVPTKSSRANFLVATAPTSSEVVKTTAGGTLLSQFSVADGVPIWMDADAEGDVAVLKVGSKLAPGSSVITVFKASGTTTSTPSRSDPVRRLYFSGTDLYGLRASGSFSKLGASGGFSWNLGSLDQPLLIDGTAAGIFVVVEAAKGRLHVINLQTGSTSDVPLYAAEATSMIAKTNRHNDAARAAGKGREILQFPRSR